MFNMFVSGDEWDSAYDAAISKAVFAVVVTASLFTVRSCGYRLVVGPARNELFALRSRVELADAEPGS